MVTTPHYDLDIDTTLGGNNASDYVIPSQKAIKSYVDNTSSTVDQTYDSTSANAQSGVAIAGAGFLTSSALSDYVQASNGNMTFINAGTEGDILYTDSTTGDFYGVIVGQSSTYGTGVTIGAGNAVAQNGYMLNLTLNGFAMIDASNMGTALLTVSNNNLAVNGTEVVTGDNTRFDGQWIDANEAIISSNTSLSGSTYLSKRITLPDDNHKYEVLIRGSIYTSSTSGKEVFLKVKGNEDSYDRYIARCITRTSSSMYSSGTTLITASYVASNQTNLTIARDSSWGGNCSELTVVAYRRIGTNT